MNTLNIAYFLTPKKDIVYETTASTMRQAIERMEFHRFSAVPILNENGEYVGTLTEGDLLRKLKSTPGLDFGSTRKIPIADVPLRVNNQPVRISCHMEDLVMRAINQNFVPVLDDEDKFIGIIKRSDIIHYCYKKLFSQVEKGA